MKERERVRVSMCVCVHMEREKEEVGGIYFKGLAHTLKEPVKSLVSMVDWQSGYSKKC